MFCCVITLLFDIDIGIDSDGKYHITISLCYLNLNYPCLVSSELLSPITSGGDKIDNLKHVEGNFYIQPAHQHPCQPIYRLSWILYDNILT